MNKVIEVKNLSKKYLIPHKTQPLYSTLVETLGSAFKKHVLRSNDEGGFEEFWALKDLSLDIHEGDCVGLIGKNGAGKSTFLKILSRITGPTEGSVRIWGRVASLLEVGTGFHPELSGKENIFLNGTILGMRRREIEKKFDEIVAFSELEKFLDTPVKRYSSGMFARLGFAIAAHLDSDVLIVDEVLAVGDAAFQEKCLKKLNELGTSGRTVLFVSHDVGSVLSLCNKGIYLENGQLKNIGPIDQCVNAYMKSCKTHDFVWEGNVGDENIRVSHVQIIKKNQTQEFFYQGEEVRVEITFEALRPVCDLFFSVGIWNQRHQQIARSTTTESYSSHPTGMHQLSFTFDTAIFHEGDYLLKIESFIHNERKILQDEIILKCPIYLFEKETRGMIRDGVTLGNRWNQEFIYV